MTGFPLEKKPANLQVSVMTVSSDQHVSDAQPQNWVYRFLPQFVWPYAQLARWDRPIGWWLLMWPCWWSLALATGLIVSGAPSTLAISPAENGWLIFFVVIAFKFFCFWLGAVMMRGAGCTYNDWVDVDFDARVARTASRPIPSGRVSPANALLFLLFQAFVGLLCLIGLSTVGHGQLQTFPIILGIASLAVVAAYPFAKRVTDWPQFVLGLAFSWGALMGWAVMFGEVSTTGLLLYAASILWVIGYDTIYAHQDREDDALIGVRSTARLFGEKTKPALVIIYLGTVGLMIASFASTSIGWPAYLGVAGGIAHMIWQVQRLNIDDPDNCLALFKSNSTFGWIIFAGLMFALFV